MDNKNYILFSAIGNTDPYSVLNCKGKEIYNDGSFLHIVRHYKPKKAVVYMSQSICEKDKEGLYDKCLQKLCEAENFTCELEKIKKPNLIDADLYNDIIGDLRTILQELLDENHDYEILINVSSGTTSMKTALLTLSICNEYATKIKPVQVRAPLESIQEASIITKIEKNPDGMVKVNVCEMAENAQNRCVVNFENYLYLIIKDKLLNMIDSYHYSSAFDLASASKELFNEKQKNILQLAKYREDLKTKKAKELEKILNIKILPIIPNDKSFEFLLYLKVKYKRGELIEFCRAVSPLFTEMGKIILAKYFGLIPDDYIDESSGKFKKKGNISKIVFIPDNIFKNEKEKPFIATQNLLELMILANDQNKRNISQKKDNSFFSEMIKNYGELRRMEETIRNSVAHTMSSINSKDFKDKVGKSINEFVQFLIDFYDKYINEIKKNNLTNNYDEMNKQIKIFFDINQNKI